MANHETPMRVHYTVNDSDILSLGCFVYLCGIINNKICTANEKQKYIYREGEGSPFWGIYSQPFVPNLRVDFLDAGYRAMEIFIFLMGKDPATIGTKSARETSLISSVITEFAI